MSSINRKTIPKFCDISLASHITNLCLILALCKFLKDVNITSKCRQQGLKKGLSAFTLEMKRRIKCLDYKMGMADPALSLFSNCRFKTSPLMTYLSFSVFFEFLNFRMLMAGLCNSLSSSTSAVCRYIHIPS